MMDPTAMASMGAPAPDPAAATGASSSRQQQQLSVPCLTHNVRVVENARGLMSIVAGSITGILGVTGVVQGAATFLLCYVLTSLGLLLKMRGRVPKYLPIRWHGFLLADAANHVLSFLLFWCMAYTLVHIY